jgi:excinuclease UvrABC helicase subunit UvrB
MKIKIENMRKTDAFESESSDDENSNIYEEDDLVLCKTSDGKIRSCGFSINNLLLREGKPAMVTMNYVSDNSTPETKTKTNVSDLFRNLAVPVGYFYIQPKTYSNDQSHYIEEEEDLDEELHEKLLNLASALDNKKNKRSKKAYIVVGRKNQKTKKLKHNKELM